MKLRFGIVFALLAALVVAANVGVVDRAEAQGFGPGGFFPGCPMFGFRAPRAPAAPSYTGPLDVLSTNVWAAYSTRCTKSSYTGDVVDLKDTATGVTDETLISCNSGGTQNTSSPNAIATTCGTACYPSTWYDQTGLNNCTSATCNEASTNVDGTGYVRNITGTVPGMSFFTGRGVESINAATLSQPFWISFIVKTPSSIANNGMYGDSANSGGSATTPGPTFTEFANSNVTSATIATSTFYSVQMIFNGASSQICVNNSCGSMANAGTGGIGARFYLGQDGYGDILGSGGYIVEAIIYTGTPPGGRSSLATNQCAYVGVSC
jgi:hypothetical protein